MLGVAALQWAVGAPVSQASIATVVFFVQASRVLKDFSRRSASSGQMSLVTRCRQDLSAASRWVSEGREKVARVKAVVARCVSM
jgi:hypothetical protein